MKTKGPGDIPSVSIELFIKAIEDLRPDEPYLRRTGVVPFSTKDQWLGWLSQYDTPGYYDRKGSGYDAKFAYNHVQNHQMLIWLLAAAGLDAPTLSRAGADAEQGKTMAQRAAAVRKRVPWEHAFGLLWPNGLNGTK